MEQIMFKKQHPDRQQIAVIPAQAGIHFAFLVSKQDQHGFPFARE
jgi:hypothetical protein